MTSSDELTWACGLCGRVLNRYVIDGTTTYDHMEDDRRRTDHEALPVKIPMSQANMRCDFCHDDTSIFNASTLVTKDVVIVTGGRTDHMGTEWIADRKCADLIVKGDWDALLKQGLEGYERRHVQPLHPGTVALMTHLYKLVREAFIRIDPPPPIPEESP